MAHRLAGVCIDRGGVGTTQSSLNQNPARFVRWRRARRPKQKSFRNRWHDSGGLKVEYRRSRSRYDHCQVLRYRQERQLVRGFGCIHQRSRYATTSACSPSTRQARRRCLPGRGAAECLIDVAAPGAKTAALSTTGTKCFATALATASSFALCDRPVPTLFTISPASFLTPR